MIIDFHTHVFPDKIAEKTVLSLAEKANVKPYTNGTVDNLLSSMEKAGVDICVALPVLTSPKQFDSVNRFALELNERFANTTKRIISFAGIHPNCEDIDAKMRFIKDNGFLGVKIHPDYQNTFIDDEKYLKIIELANKFDLIILTHAGVDDGFIGEPVKCSPERVKKVIEKLKPNKFILAHYGASKMWQEVLENLCGLNVYLDTSFTFNNISDELFIKILNKHGADKILFATDSPWQDLDYSVKKFKSLKLEKCDEDKILFKNATKLLKIGE